MNRRLPDHRSLCPRPGISAVAMREAFGPGYQLPVVSEQHLQRVAAASCQPNRTAAFRPPVR